MPGPGPLRDQAKPPPMQAGSGIVLLRESAGEVTHIAAWRFW
jgi:hypothetical protein